MRKVDRKRSRDKALKRNRATARRKQREAEEQDKISQVQAYMKGRPDDHRFAKRRADRLGLSPEVQARIGVGRERPRVTPKYTLRVSHSFPAHTGSPLHQETEIVVVGNIGMSHILLAREIGAPLLPFGGQFLDILRVDMDELLELTRAEVQALTDADVRILGNQRELNTPRKSFVDLIEELTPRIMK